MQWAHVPFEHVGPLRYVMSAGEAALGVMARAQRAGDVLLSRAFFVGAFQDWACALHDCVPSDEWDIR